MAASGERVRLEIAFLGGHTVGALVPVPSVEALQQALARGEDGVFELDGDDGRYLIPTKSVVYVKRFSRDTQIGFGAA